MFRKLLGNWFKLSFLLLLLGFLYVGWNYTNREPKVVVVEVEKVVIVEVEKIVEVEVPVVLEAATGDLQITTDCDRGFYIYHKGETVVPVPWYTGIEPWYEGGNLPRCRTKNEPIGY